MCWECGSAGELEKVWDEDDVEGRCPNCGREFESVIWDRELD